jgi:hypothetical protein
MKARTHFNYRIDLRNDTGEIIIDNLAGVEDFEVAVATYRAAVKRWPKAIITLRQGVRVIHDSRQPQVHDGRQTSKKSPTGPDA